MPSVFASSEGPCGVFGGTSPCGGGTGYVLSHARAAHLLHGAAPVQDARGELRLSYVGIGSIALDMQPVERKIVREPHGVIVEVGWIGFAMGATNLRELDRTIFFGQHLEVVNVARWGGHEEISYREIGR